MVKQQPITSAAVLPFAERFLSRPDLSLWLALLYMVVMTVIGLTFHTVGDYDVETAFFETDVPHARLVASGELPIAESRGPVYAILLGVASLVGLDLFRSAIVLGALAGGIILFAAHRVLARVFQADHAFLALLVTAFNPAFVKFTYTVNPDMVFAAWSAGTILFLLGKERPTRRDLVLAALCAAGAYLTSYAGVYVIVAVPILFLWMNAISLPWKERLAATRTFLVAFVIAIAPWGIYQLIQTGDFFGFEFSPGLSSHFFSDLVALLGWPGGVLVLLGIAQLVFVRPTNLQAAFYVYGLVFFVTLIGLDNREGESLILIPFYASLAISALSWEGLRSITIFKRATLSGVLGLVLVVWTFHVSYQFNRQNINAGPREIPVIAEAFKASTPQPDKNAAVAARRPHIAYFLDMRLTPYPAAPTLDSLRSALDAQDASYVFFSRMEAGRRPEFSALLDPARAPAWLVPVSSTSVPPAVLYRIERNTQQPAE